MTSHRRNVWVIGGYSWPFPLRFQRLNIWQGLDKQSLACLPHLTLYMKSLLEASSQTNQLIPSFIAVTVAIPSFQTERERKTLLVYFANFFSVSLSLFDFVGYSREICNMKSKCLIYNNLQLLMWSESAGRRFEFQPRTDLSQTFNRTKLQLLSLTWSKAVIVSRK